MPLRQGRKSASQTPTPKSERIYGSEKNPKGSASSSKSAKNITFSDKTIKALQNKLDEFKEKHKGKKNITLGDLKAVYRRGSGAYSSSHRAGISRNGWAMARVNKFLLKAGGTKVKAAYVQDDDLLKMHLGGDMSKHLAPNGKPSNLTHEQWHLVRTPEFKAWFGDWEKNPKKASKVVDTNGEPLVVYHGTNAKFTIFDTDENSKNRKGGTWNAEYPDGYIFMTSDTNTAKRYGKNIIPLFVNLKYPIIKKIKKGQSLVLPFDDEGLAFEGDAIVTDGTDYVIGTQDEFAVKLADGTNTTFDSSNPDIRYDGGGEIPNNLRELPYYKGAYKGAEFYSMQEGKYQKMADRWYDLMQKHQGGKKLSKIEFEEFEKLSRNLYRSDEYADGGEVNEIVYHGSPNKFEKFELEKVGTTTGRLTGGYGIYFTNKEEVAKEYALKGGSFIQAKLKVSNFFDLDDNITNVDKILEQVEQDERFTENDVDNLKSDYLGMSDYGYEVATNRQLHEWLSDTLDEQQVSEFIEKLGYDGTTFVDKWDKYARNYVIFNPNDVEIVDIEKLAKGKKLKSSGGGDCYYIAGQFAMDNIFSPNKIDYVGTPYLVHAEVQGQGHIAHIRYGHAWVEDDENVYDFSNGRELVIPKPLYYAIGDIRTDNPKKYQKYTFAEARQKMVQTKHYGCWDLDVEYKDGGEVITYDEKDLYDIMKYQKFQKSFKDGGLIAPNGKTSNLTPEQYKLVRTPEFKAWFGDWENNPKDASKVVDENGEPLVCYHSTDKKFNFFDKNKIGTKNDEGTLGRGFYFDTLLDMQIRGEGTPISTWATKIILKCFLNIKNPKLHQNDVWFWEKRESIKYTNKIIKEGYDGILIEGSYGGKNNPYNPYDGFYPHWYVAFEPKQIKLADGTNTTFDSSNPDIRYDDGGLITVDDMLKHPLTIKRLYDLDDGKDWWADTFHAKTNNYKSNTYYHLNTGGSNAGVGKGLYLGRDKDALVAFYDVEQENKTVDTYVGNPNWLDLIDYKDYELFEEEAIKKYGKNSNKSILDIDERGEMLKKLAIDKGFDGVRYYDPQATGEEFVLFNTKKVKKINNYADGGLIAPNGKPSNLNAEQYKLVRTPEFKAWFGDWENDPENASKVLDENGEPLVVYHGTMQKFNLFRTYFDNGTWHGKGAYFTSSLKDLKTNYVTTKEDIYLDCFLNIKNPLVVGKKNESTWFEKKEREIILQQLRYYKFPKVNYAYENSWDSDRLEKIIREEFRESQSGELLNSIYRELGFDGIIFLSPHKLKGHKAPLKTKHFVCFKPNQIKLADGTNTTFDSSNPDIRYDDGGDVDDLGEIFVIKNKLKSGVELLEAYMVVDKTNPFVLQFKNRAIYCLKFSKNKDGKWHFYNVAVGFTKEEFKEIKEKSLKPTLQNTSIIIGAEKKILYELMKYEIDYLISKGFVLSPLFVDKYGVTYSVDKIDDDFYSVNESFVKKGKSVENNNSLDTYANLGGNVFKAINNLYKRAKEEKGMAKGGDVGQEITCRRCKWQWNTKDSEEYDKYVCHKCGFDNTLYYSDLNDDIMSKLKTPKTLSEIAKIHNVSEEVLAQQLQKGIEAEMEHTTDKKIAETIALHHIEEMPDYYDRLKEMESGNEIIKSEYKQNVMKKVRFVGDDRAFWYVISETPEYYIGVIDEKLENWQNADQVTKVQYFEDYLPKEDVEIFEKTTDQLKEGGVVVGKRHSESDENGSGERFLVKSTGQVVELEGGEGVLNKESMTSNKTYEFQGKKMSARQIASFLNHKYGGVEFAEGGDVKSVCGCKSYYHGGELPSATLDNLEGGEAVVTVKTMESKDKYQFQGMKMTPRKILSQINADFGGKKFEEGGTIDISDYKLQNEIKLANMYQFVQKLLYHKRNIM